MKLTSELQKELNKETARIYRAKANEIERISAEQVAALRAEAERLDPLFDEEHPPAGGVQAPGRKRVPRPQKGRGKAKGVTAGKPPRLDADGVQAAAGEVLSVLRRDPGEPLSCQALAAETGLPTNQVGQALQYLVKQETVTKRGEKRASVYLVEETPVADVDEFRTPGATEAEAEIDGELGGEEL